MPCARCSPQRFLNGVTVAAVAGDLPQGGLYRVEVTLEIPNVQGELAFRSVERCIAAGEAAEPILVIVSSPKIAECPVVRQAGEVGWIEVEVACERVNTGRARERFELTAAGYTGRIAITMGAKNMTLTEIQRAVRIGDCP